MQNSKELEEVEEKGGVKEIKGIEDRGVRGQNFWGKCGYPTPGYFGDVYQKKGDAGASVRIYVKAKKMREICRKTREEERKRGAAVRKKFERTCGSVY